MIISKTDTVRSLVANGDYKKTLGIVKGFSLGISKEALNKGALAYECMIYPEFYRQIGKDPTTAVNEGIQILKDLYGQSKEH